MKLTAMMAMAAVMGTSAWARETILANDRPVTVCMNGGTHGVTALQAKTAASKMFAEIGVKIDWRNPSACPADALRISLSMSTPATLLPGALAYALPYEGTHIVVFYDRLQLAVHPGRLPRLLAHVLVHEITHILQGVNRHSDNGVMKARWESSDLSAMDSKSLGFAEDDVRLIHLGLAGRATRLIASR